ncbi:Probable hydrogenase nickel incorporation protein hypA [Slackia heliotrinireducens]|uniref:Hydrogenase maturation factor HypA n=1 Tax=Slackia heliotrinireducens (strain ATCC 29202 / DSM 20476 / NCTC 11029 / RHS 1) TaxID=471855 RepID=C7N748_SLAHD|nr:hydrogenase maturation nickel metallochaperone HypA [Slackia heliotrinireducens]ACV22733.1 Zn finger protein HypA/HybF (possibly regulating hydrogenase expression) [Slackia heliotrinireducens DSM 20476]VEH01372.1 Probable hydrogenase nickel incorporation protein hypA [Slackia heliotrinireducens]
MHEMGLVHPLVDMVVDYAVQAGASEVKAVYVTIGDGRDIVMDLMEGLFKHLVRGTLAENAELIVEHVPYRAECNECQGHFTINQFKRSTWTCPHCGAERKYRIVSGLEFMVNRIEIVRGTQFADPNATRGAA